MVYNGTMTKAHSTYQLLRSISFQKATSDVVTPWDLAIQMVDAIPENLFNTNVVVPGSGFGTFALALVHRGWEPSKITCIEIDPAFALISQKRVGSFGVKIVHADFLAWNPDMQFDVVITNVPFQAPTPEGQERNIGRQLWHQFIEKSLELTKDNGYTSLITPATWLQRKPNSPS